MLLSLLMVCCLNAPPEVTLESESIVAGAILPLPASDPRSAVSLGRAPEPGLARRIPNSEIVSRIRAAGFNTADLRLPESILVRRKSGAVSAEEARDAITQEFERRFPTARIELAEVANVELRVPTSGYRLNAALPPRVDPQLPIFVRLDAQAPGFQRSVHVRVVARIEVVQPVLRARVPAQTEIRGEQIDWIPAPLGGKETPASLDAVRGMLAKRNLEAGEVLRTDDLYMPLYVRKGDTVTVKATSGGVTVAATMRARAGGGLGDTIVVEHLSGPGTVTARVVGARTLEAIQR
jgi:flagella basal body P-ring formation protein FlgA